MLMFLLMFNSSKGMKDLGICKLGEEDYLALKDKLFKDETVDSLYEKIKAYQDYQENAINDHNNSDSPTTRNLI